MGVVRTRLSTMTEPEPTPSTCCFDEWAASNARRARTKETVAPVTTALLAALEAEGLEGRTILDVGCGTGDLALAALAHGAASARGIDLGKGSIDLARALSRDRGLDDRVAFEVADGSVAALPSTDVVVLNRVVCCYPDARRLLHNTLGVCSTGSWSECRTSGTRSARRSSAASACSSTI
jgi:2-polyprenyl-3-methyl-5-hydroxy-6-metoxy-1,4-benzoquinol methylase